MNQQGREVVTVRLENLQVVVGYRRLFEIREFEFPAGEVTAIVGANGRGKTTLMRCIAGLSQPAKGRVVRGGLSGGKGKDGLSASCLYLASLPGLLLDQSLIRNLEFYCNSQCLVPTRVQLVDSLQRVGLAGREEQNSRSLSTGQKRRLTFAALSLIRPRILLADEPTNGLDGDGRLLCHHLLGELKKAGATVMVATHDTELIALCGRVLDIEEHLPRKAQRNLSLEFL